MARTSGTRSVPDTVLSVSVHRGRTRFSAAAFCINQRSAVWTRSSGNCSVVQRAIAQGLSDAVLDICGSHNLDTVVLSGGVFQNELLLEDIKELFASVEVWTNHLVPPNDGGISLGQAALACFGQFNQVGSSTLQA